MAGKSTRWLTDMPYTTGIYCGSVKKIIQIVYFVFIECHHTCPPRCKTICTKKTIARNNALSSLTLVINKPSSSLEIKLIDKCPNNGIFVQGKSSNTGKKLYINYSYVLFTRHSLLPKSGYSEYHFRGCLLYNRT